MSNPKLLNIFAYLYITKQYVVLFILKNIAREKWGGEGPAG